MPMKHNEIVENLKFLKDAGVDVFMSNSPRIYYKENNPKDPRISTDQGAKDVNEISNLEELKEEIYKFDKCDLKKTAKSTVIADGNPASKIMLIGEAPGADEDRQGIPFVGRAGQLLNRMLEAINLQRKDVYITNIVPWRPPENRQPTNEEIVLCLPFIQRHIELINPKILVLLGGTAAKALLFSDKGIMRLRGKWHDYSSYGLANPILTRAIFHPSFLLRSPGYKRTTWNDLQEIKKELDK
ncbi:MAG: hypothetical protein CFH21_00077 [Alphaproteobacteria bacterium MarineAlpha5_Bin11]|mgnify:CR=1 FL=1|nr:MAG: hypothetical protein CFH21_00077 [Alphaproteobacteria bacterium MarineAlpha5_Bin11]PPR52229.1 MAG: hypothetical protein CFH20_00134 [Alphaproteobacteria bacterium MarineAlpha5_Bin10]|tara:strand:- start:931 stop:1656 length:726 start_codon:yes stop_codon:yes gene_type:complete